MKMNKKTYTELLVSWYNQHKRDLPWRINQDPYRVWVSEIMLQQTQVNTVIPYYLRFLDSFDSIESLAHADEMKLLKHWEGLGYYNRVRNMQKAALQIMEKHQGVFPTCYEDIIELKGIGEYTAGAIMSIAFDLPYPAVDGNVLRVIARLIEYPKDIKTKTNVLEIQNYVRDLYLYVRPTDLTQALMELGALICTPKNPLCDQCPIQTICQSYKNQTQLNFPVIVKKLKRSYEEKTVIVFKCQDAYGLQVRKDKAVLEGLYEFFNVEMHLTKSEILRQVEQLKASIISVQTLSSRKHVFTHKDWLLKVYLIEVNHRFNGFDWYKADYIKEEIPLPTVFKQIFLEALLV